ncbi:MAG: DUF2147 domain-containing protein [Prevotellaceae bacterium]|jgi:uncharacterized protein (DUF2147 family)|nr:DUF2147 domain-containing protein [Prevotellaceae bacterium]
MKKLILFFGLFLATVTANAQVEKLVGYWTSIDDKTSTEKSVFQIFKATNGKYYGKLLKLLEPGRSGAVCDKCTGADKDKPLEGMILLKDLTLDGDNLVGGTILDPENGKTYYCKVSYDAKTDRLKMKGSIDKAGILSRSQYWVRRKGL